MTPADALQFVYALPASADIHVRFTLTVILTHSGADGVCCLTMAEIAEKAGVCSKTVQRTLARMEGEGYIQARRTGRGSEYRVAESVLGSVNMSNQIGLRVQSDRTESPIARQCPISSDTESNQIGLRVQSGKKAGNGSPSSPSLPVSPAPSSHPTPIIPSLPDGIEKHTIPPVNSASQNMTSPSGESERPKPSKKLIAETPDFVAFYSVYPNKKARPEAWKAWQKISPDEAIADCIMAGLRQQVRYWRQKYGKDTSFIPHPATWLNQRRWEDDVSEEVITRGIPPHVSASRQTAQERAEEKMRGIYERAVAREKARAGP